jgi:hypothetical protein
MKKIQPKDRPKGLKKTGKWVDPMCTPFDR